MTEHEFQRAKRAHAQMAHATLRERIVSWVKGVFSRRAVQTTKDARLALLDSKAEVERKAHQSI